MSTICMFRGIEIYINYRDHQPPHFNASYGDYECSININDIELMNGEMPNQVAHELPTSTPRENMIFQVQAQHERYILCFVFLVSWKQVPTKGSDHCVNLSSTNVK